MIGSFLLWYLLITLVGWLAFPLSYFFLPQLKDRGYALARPLGLLVWGYFFWLLASLHVIQNDSGGQLFSLLLLAAFSLAVAWRKCGGPAAAWQQMRAWLAEHWTQVLRSEILFVLFFALWAFVRAANPEILGTEKPMELAFINAILRSPTFPPYDPWLSGYAISYYYFGYVMIAMFTRLTATASGVAFNLASAMWFGMIALAAYGLLYTLLARWAEKRYSPARAQLAAGGWAWLAPLFLLVVSNVEGLLEILHKRGLFWSVGADGALTSSFWKWLDIQELSQPPALPFGWLPERVGGTVWWRASRVLQDYNLNDQNFEVIDEFPFFSYYLADLHPHVLAIPFVLLAVGLALNLYLSGADQPFEPLQPRTWLRKPYFWLTAGVMGSLSFLNTWDFPIYVGLFVAAYGLLRYQQVGWRMQRVWEMLALGLTVGVTGVLLFAPFYMGFSSQAGGLVPSMSFFTRGAHLWVMFGTLLVPVLLWALTRWNAAPDRQGISLLSGLKVAAAVIFGLWGVSFLFGWIIACFSVLGNAILTANPNGPLASTATQMLNLSGQFYQLHGASDALGLLLGSLARRLAQPGGWITLLAALMLVWALLARTHSPRIPAEGDDWRENEDASPFVLVLVLLGLGLVIFPEFFYLRDQFGWRMNTIFKFYYQAWVVWSLAAAYATVVLLHDMRRWFFGLAAVVMMLVGLAYPVSMLSLRLEGAQRSQIPLTLDGNAYLQRAAPDEVSAIRWLSQAPLGTMVEAVGGSYSQYARISTLSGMPTVLGWPGHEGQWRGGGKEIGSREKDIERLYRTADWREARDILQMYGIRYIYVGNLERSTYRVDEIKFQSYLKPVYQNNSVTIYGVPDLSTALPVQAN